MQYAPGEVPKGVTLGDKVLVVPDLSQLFSHSGVIFSDMQSRGYGWIKRGDPIARYTIYRPKIDLPFIRHFSGSDVCTADIRSPVSGIILNYNYGFQDIAYNQHGGFSILLPDDEPLAEGSEYLFQSVCSLVRHFMHYFNRPSRYWTMEGVSEEKLFSEIKQQLSLNCTIIDALPRYKDYFDEARTKQPSLRPHIKHLR